MSDNPVRDYIREHPFKGPFRPHVSYSDVGDFLYVWWADERCYADGDHDGFDLMRSMNEPSRVVGVKVHGVGRLPAAAGSKDSSAAPGERKDVMSDG